MPRVCNGEGLCFMDPNPSVEAAFGLVESGGGGGGGGGWLPHPIITCRKRR